MKVYKTKSQKDKLFFTNYQRIEEKIIFNDVYNILENNPLVTIGEKKIFPSEDIFTCYIDNEEFKLVYDIDYGGYIQSNSEKALIKIENILNN